MWAIVWRFKAKEGKELEFETAYGPEGDWARFFRRDEHYRGTELLKDSGGSYLTIDRWDSRESCESFRSRHPEEYRSLDQRCESLTDDEQIVGMFTTVA
jgi:heme-degrading monooxygenase HmoA